MPTWLITGCSTGLGRALAGAVLDRGDNALITAREPATLEALVADHPDNAAVTALDVTDSAQVAGAVRLVERRFGALDVLVNNAGYGYRTAVEEGHDVDVRAVFATNFDGPVSLIKAVLPGMRDRRSGVIVNVSSIGARACAAGSGYYAASKAALEALSASLRKEVGPLGITVMVVEPGAFRTDFAGRSLRQSDTIIADYHDTAGQRRREREGIHGLQIGDPAKAAQAIMAAVDARQPPALLVLGNDAVDYFRAVSDGLLSDITAWEATSRSTDFTPDDAPSGGG